MGDRFATEGGSTVGNGGVLMVRKGLIRRGPSKRKLGDIVAQLSVSACVLLLPPLVMAAGVMVFGSSPPQGQQAVVQEATALPTASGLAAERSNRLTAGTTSFALASADTRPVVTERRPASEQPAVAAQRAPTGQPAKDPTRYTGVAPVTLVHAGKASEQAALVEAPAPAAAEAPIAVPEESPAATRTNGSRGRSRMGRRESRPAYRVRYQRTRSMSDVFMHSGSRHPRG
jgi:hypothetical protein